MHTKPNRIPDTIKFIFETTTLNNISPGIISKALLIVQKGMDWKSVLDTKVNATSMKYTVPQTKISLIHECSTRFFKELSDSMESFSYRSVLHGNRFISEISFMNFIAAYVNLLDCLFHHYIDELKQFNEGSIMLMVESNANEGNM